MATISFNGLASGLDTKSIISQLTQLRQQQLLGPVSDSLNTTKNKQTALSPITTALSNLGDKAKTLYDASNVAYNIKKAESSDSSILNVTGVDSTKAVSGTYSITNITQLAQPDRVIFEGVADTGVSQFGTGTFTMTYKGKSHNIAVDSTNNTLDGLKSAINSADIGVTASIINDGSSTTPYRLVLTSDDTGADAAITNNISSVLTLTEDATSSNAANEPADAVFKINSVAFTSHTNTVTDAIAGVTFNLLGLENTDPITLTVKQDTSGIVSKIQAFVSAFNSTRAALKSAINPDPDSKKYGPLGHDPMMNEIYYKLGNIMASRLLSVGSYHSLAELGITADKNGTMAVDTGKLTGFLESNPDSVRKLFQGTTATNGIAEQMYTYMDNLNNPLGTIAQRNKQLTENVTRLNKLSKDRAVMVSQYQARLSKQFSMLETTITRLKGSQDAVTQFQTMTNNSSSGN